MSQLKRSMQAARTAGDIAQEAQTASVPPEPESLLAVPYKIGAPVEGEGIFGGIWRPFAGLKDMDRKITERTWLVFAAPEDLGQSSKGVQLWNFYEAADELAKRKNWHGHDGVGYQSEQTIRNHLLAGQYQGQWFIPPLKILRGKNDQFQTAQGDNLYGHRRAGKFGFKIKTEPKTDDSQNIYWSSTPSEHTSRMMHFVDFRNGNTDCDHAHEFPLNCRPVRLKEVRLG